MNLRLSAGSAVLLGLKTARMLAAPTTLYSLLGETCLGACRFCTQSRTSQTDRKFLSRVAWPAFDLQDVLARVSDASQVRRICIQTLNYPDLLPELLTVVSRVKRHSALPISVCLNPVNKQRLQDLKNAGVERVGVGLDCASPATFEAFKPGFHWNVYMRFVEDMIEVFGVGAVHLIVGLGDTDKTLVNMFQRLYDMGSYVALFALTPVRGVDLDLPPPDIGRYRALQLARYLIMQGQATAEDARFEGERLVSLAVPPTLLARALESGQPFRTSGCPNCNRPLYNERPGGTMYNYPAPLTEEEIYQVREELASIFQH